MPQEFQVLCCYKCETHQVHQQKKANKWSCKVCGEKQSLMKVFAVGSSKDCRIYVQKMNFKEGMIKSVDKLDKEYEQHSYLSKSFPEEEPVTCEQKLLQDSYQTSSIENKERKQKKPRCDKDISAEEMIMDSVMSILKPAQSILKCEEQICAEEAKVDSVMSILISAQYKSHCQ